MEQYVYASARFMVHRVLTSPLVFASCRDSILGFRDCRQEAETRAQKEITSQIDYYLVILSSNALVFEDKLTKYQSD